MSFHVSLPTYPFFPSISFFFSFLSALRFPSLSSYIRDNSKVAVIFVVLYGKTGMSMIVFCTLMAVGEFFRLVFLEATPARKLPPTFTAGRRRVLVGFVFTYIIVYLVVAAMETTTVIADNQEYISPDVLGF
jgi:hypothetical protein